MKKRSKFWIFCIIGIIVISNLPPVNYFFQEDYNYQTENGSFKYTEMPGSGLDFEVGKIRFGRFKSEIAENDQLILYRTFNLKPWRFWEWWNMLSNFERFELPYLSR